MESIFIYPINDRSNFYIPEFNDQRYYLHEAPLRKRCQQKIQRSTSTSSETSKNSFTINLDVQQFRPEEITVKVVEKNMISVEARHGERQDEHGSISRHFVRKYVLPQGYDPDKVSSKLSSDGVLFISAPKVNEAVQFREIPIVQTGKPLREVGEIPKENEEESEQ